MIQVVVVVVEFISAVVMARRWDLVEAVESMWVVVRGHELACLSEYGRSQQ